MEYENFKEFMEEWCPLDDRNLLIWFDLDIKEVRWNLMILQSRKERTQHVTVGALIPFREDLITLGKLSSMGLQDLRNTMRQCKRLALKEWNARELPKLT